MPSKSSKARKSTQRKLTAILCADVVGYSRLMRDDEEATIETPTAYRKVFTSKIKKRRGRVVDARGDAILADLLRHHILTIGLNSSLGAKIRAERPV